jgi:hypothetical protein
MTQYKKAPTITVGTNEYAFGPLTTDRAFALMTLWECIRQAGANPLALASSKALSAASQLCAAYGLPAGSLLLHELLSATRQIMELATLESAPYLSESVIPEITQLQSTADQIAGALTSAPVIDRDTDRPGIIHTVLSSEAR